MEISRPATRTSSRGQSTCHAPSLVRCGRARCDGVAATELAESRAFEDSSLTRPHGAAHFSKSMPTQTPHRVRFAGADDPAEELLTEPSRDAVRLAELEQENRRLRDELRHLLSALASAAGLLLPYHRRLNGSR